MSGMPRLRTPLVLIGKRSSVIGLVVGSALAPVLLAVMGRSETPVPPAAFITVAVFCWALVPRLFIELLPSPRVGRERASPSPGLLEDSPVAPAPDRR
jgi:hypothetical protein